MQRHYARGNDVCQERREREGKESFLRRRFCEGLSQQTVEFFYQIDAEQSDAELGMRKRHRKPGISETVIPKEEEKENPAEEGKGFFACYLLASLSPRHKGHIYIGFTVNPRRRIRQHNGEIGSGAWRTKCKRPWEMVLCIYGFPTNVSALQFEWAWQHPTESLAVRKAAASFKSLSGIANKIKLAYTMLTLPTWNTLNITVNYVSTKYTKHSAGCPTLPENMSVQVSQIDELPCYVERDERSIQNEDSWDEEDEEACDDNNFLPVIFLESTLVHDENHSQDDEAIITEIDRQVEKTGPSGIFTGSSSTETPVDELDAYRLSKSNEKLKEQERKGEKAGVAATAYNARSRCNIVPCGVELIDVSTPTPSPDCRISSCRKKRRAASFSVEIIDLTKSPSFIQL